VNEPRVQFNRRPRADIPCPEALRVSLDFQRPTPPAPGPDAPDNRPDPDRLALVKRIQAHPGDWRRLAMLIVDTQGPGAFNDQALETMGRVLDVLAPGDGALGRRTELDTPDRIRPKTEEKPHGTV
jgi:hypothetical protein